MTKKYLNKKNERVMSNNSYYYITFRVLFRITDPLNNQIYHDKKNCIVETYIHAS